MRTARWTAFFVTLGLLIPALPVRAQRPAPPTELHLREDTTWTKANGPHVYGYVFVYAGATLTVEPGVHAETYGIMVQGGLRAEGTPEEPIVFTGQRGWDGIDIGDWRGARPPSVIHDVRIENGATGLTMYEDAFPVHDTVFTGNDVALIVDNPAATLSFTGNEFYSNKTAFFGRTTDVIGLYENDFWDNDVSLLFQAQSPWACQNDPGIFDVHYNDILRGPDDPWFSFDVRTSDESGRSGMVVDASENWWGSVDEDDIEARMEPQIDCCPSPDRAPISWREPAALPQTATEPPGPAGTPAPEPSGHGDPAYIAKVRRPLDRECFEHGSLDRIKGTVSGALVQTPERLEVSLVRYKFGCSFYDPDTDRFGYPGNCRRRYFDVRVRDGRWHVALPRPLRAGNYYFVAGDMPGSDEVAFRVLPRGR